VAIQAIRAIRVRHKGQVTLPADIRSELGIEEGDKLFIERRGKEIVLISSQDAVDPSAGVLAEYAYTRNPDPADERRWVARHIAETADRDE